MKRTSLNLICPSEENAFWDLVKLADWPNKDSARVKIMYRKMLSKEQCKNFSGIVDIAYGILDNELCNHPEISDNLGVGDDGYGDLLHHIIGLGKKDFYKYANNLKLVEKLAHSRKYEESFAYCIPYDDDYEKNNMYTIENVIKTAKEAVKEINMFDEMDTWDEEGHRVWLKEIHNDLSNICLIIKAFLRSPTQDALKILVGKKNVVKKASKKIEKFFEKNYLELPRKFTERRKDGSDFRGMCTALFTNTVSDAEEVLEYLKT
jgi:hypothetical protein